MPLVTPTPIPAYPPAPLPTDDRVTFSTKAFALAGSYEPQRVSFNLAATQTNTNAAYAHERAVAANDSANAAAQSASNAASSVTAVNQTVADILAAKDAIQAGPVASVMGRTGVVTGLVETLGPLYTKSTPMSSAPLGQWASFSDTTGIGSDWPPGHATTNWWNVFTFGASTRKTQRASQVFVSGGYQGWTFERQLQDGVWGSWKRSIGSGAIIEDALTQNAVVGAASVTCDPSVATVHFVGIQTNATIIVPNPRGPGDQLTIKLLQYGGYPIAFGANVMMPLGASLPTLSANEWLTVTLLPTYNASRWDLYIGGKHPS